MLRIRKASTPLSMCDYETAIIVPLSRCPDLLKTGSSDNAIWEFSLAYPSWVMSKLFKYGKRTGDFLEHYFYFSLTSCFYILGAFLIIKLFYSRLLDMRWFLHRKNLDLELGGVFSTKHLSILNSSLYPSVPSVFDPSVYPAPFSCWASWCL